MQSENTSQSGFNSAVSKTKQKKTNRRSGPGNTVFFASTTVVLDSLVAVWVVQQMSHGEERVTEYAGGNGALLGGDQQHALQQRHKLPPVHLLCLHVAIVVTQDQVHLWDGESQQRQNMTGGGEGGSDFRCAPSCGLALVRVIQCV